MGATEERKLYKSERIVAFSDGVVAIAITLLMLPLADLQMSDGETVWNFIGENWGLFYASVLSWFIIAVFWVVHHRMFSKIRRVDPGLLWLNFAWLFSITVLPLPTNLMMDSPEGATNGAATLYAGVMFANTFLMLVMGIRLVRHPELVEDTGDAWLETRRGLGRSVAICGLFFVVTLATIVWGASALMLLLALFIVEPMTDRYNRRRWPEAPDHLAAGHLDE